MRNFLILNAIAYFFRYHDFPISVFSLTSLSWLFFFFLYFYFVLFCWFTSWHCMWAVSHNYYYLITNTWQNFIHQVYISFFCFIIFISGSFSLSSSHHHQNNILFHFFITCFHITFIWTKIYIFLLISCLVFLVAWKYEKKKLHVKCSCRPFFNRLRRRLNLTYNASHCPQCVPRT